jgi:prepilin-type N-terminal cleavage/methylation domain-containing protein
MKKGFTLVEIVITVMIISIVGMGLLQTHSNSMKTLKLINSRMEVNKFSTFIFSNISKNLHKKQRTVYEFIKDRYQINDDDIINYLKSATYLYTQNELFFLNFGENVDEEDGSLFQQTSSQENNKEVADEVKREGVLVEKISIKDENNNSTSLYHFSYLQNDTNNKKE